MPRRQLGGFAQQGCGLNRHKFNLFPNADPDDYQRLQYVVRPSAALRANTVN